MDLGVDVSYLQGSVDWVKVAASGTKFAYIRGGVGNDTFDGKFFANLAGARAAGLFVGVYHFIYPLPAAPGHSYRLPADQAVLHHGQCKGLGSATGDLPPVVDLEWPAYQDWTKWGCSAPQIREWAIDYCLAVEQLYGVKPLIYTYPYFASSIQCALDSRFANYKLHIASYSPQPVVPKPWTDWTIWQTGGGNLRVPNGAPVDGDVCRDIQALARP